MRVLNILLAEDNGGDIMLVRQALEENQIEHKLHVLKDGEEALRFVGNIGKSSESPCPDVLLLDLNLPKVDGSQVLRAFRLNPLCVDTPVIVVTSSDAPKDRARMAALGINRYFRKPSDFDAFMQLGAVVREVVKGNGA